MLFMSLVEAGNDCSDNFCSFIIGVWGVGLATPTVPLDSVPLGTDTNSWVLTSESVTVHNSQVICRVKQKPSEGDIIVSISICTHCLDLFF